MYIETPFRQIIIVFVKEDISKKSKDFRELKKQKTPANLSRWVPCPIKGPIWPFPEKLNKN